MGQCDGWRVLGTKAIIGPADLITGPADLATHQLAVAFTFSDIEGCSTPAEINPSSPSWDGSTVRFRSANGPRAFTPEPRGSGEIVELLER